RRQVEADREAPRLARALGNPGLERQRLRALVARRPRRQREGREEHRQRDREREEAIDQEGQPAVKHAHPPRGRASRNVAESDRATSGNENGSTTRGAAVTSRGFRTPRPGDSDGRSTLLR